MRAPERILEARRRDATFARRLAGLNKKAWELETLCGTPVALVCFDERGGLHISPDDPQYVSSVVRRYMGFPVSTRRRLDSSPAFLEQEDVVAMLDAKIQAVNRRINFLRGEQEANLKLITSQPQPLAQEAPLTPGVIDVGSLWGLEDFSWIEEDELILPDERLDALFTPEETDQEVRDNVIPPKQQQQGHSAPQVDDLSDVWSALPPLETGPSSYVEWGPEDMDACLDADYVDSLRIF